MTKFVLALILSTSIALGCDGCAGSQIRDDIDHGKDVLIDCLKTDLGQVVNDQGLTILGDVLGVIVKGGDGWQAELDDLGHRFGLPAEACAVKAVIAALGPDAAFGSGQATASSRARGLVIEKNWKFAQ